MKQSVKNIIAVILSVIVIASVWAIPVRNEGEGIKFFEGTWSEALQKAKDEKKPIFLDISASWCGPCKMLKRKTFNNKEVAEYFNANFINVSVDGEIGEGKILADKFRVPGYPALYITDEKGNIMNYEVGYMGAKDLLHFAKNLARIKQ